MQIAQLTTIANALSGIHDTLIATKTAMIIRLDNMDRSLEKMSHVRSNLKVTIPDIPTDLHPGLRPSKSQSQIPRPKTPYPMLPEEHVRKSQETVRRMNAIRNKSSGTVPTLYSIQQRNEALALEPHGSHW